MILKIGLRGGSQGLDQTISETPKTVFSNASSSTSVACTPVTRSHETSVASRLASLLVDKFHIYISGKKKLTINKEKEKW